MVAEQMVAMMPQVSNKCSGSTEYLSPGEVCTLLGVSKPTLWRWEREGKLMPVRIGKVVRYRKTDLAIQETKTDAAL